MSKELEALEKIKKEFGCDPAYYGFGVEFEKVQQALLKAEKLEKAWEIIKEIGISQFHIQLIKCTDNYEEYRARYELAYRQRQEWTKLELLYIQEEFELLKEVLE